MQYKVCLIHHIEIISYILRCSIIILEVYLYIFDGDQWSLY